MISNCNCGGSYGALAQEPEGAAMTAAASASGSSALRSVGLGVLTGLIVWTLTRALDGRRRPAYAPARRSSRRRR